VQPGLVLQGLRHRPADATPDRPMAGLRIGFTVTRKVGSAVVRNRARRRLRAALEAVLKDAMPQGWDLVLVARAETPRRPFALLVVDLRRALGRLGALAAPAPASDGARA